jgi:hypothetical protein
MQHAHHEPFVLKSTNQVMGAQIMPATTVAVAADAVADAVCPWALELASFRSDND